MTYSTLHYRHYDVCTESYEYTFSTIKVLEQFSFEQQNCTHTFTTLNQLTLCFSVTVPRVCMWGESDVINMNTQYTHTN